MREAGDKNRLASLKPRLRIDFGEGIRLGPGKIDLLEAIIETGSISGAGRKIGMSYRRAWLLVEELNTLFTAPVVSTSAGGAHGGGTEVTPFGLNLVAAFRRLEARTQGAIAEEFSDFSGAIAPPQARKP
ncbi:MAG: winged helix-turn-helix domain-containing protein [Proteobacteria bacterium]|nr:winged helix-turn-helix domain-containing protein [Pseudomonadota bacterium]